MPMPISVVSVLVFNSRLSIAFTFGRSPFLTHYPCDDPACKCEQSKHDVPTS